MLYAATLNLIPVCLWYQWSMVNFITELYALSVAGHLPSGLIALGGCAPMVVRWVCSSAHVCMVHCGHMVCVHLCWCVYVGSKSSSGGGAGASSSGAPPPKKQKPMPTTSTTSSSGGGASKTLFADPVRLSQTSAAPRQPSSEGGPPVESESSNSRPLLCH